MTPEQLLENLQQQAQNEESVALEQKYHSELAQEYASVLEASDDVYAFLEKYDMKLVLEVHGDHGTGVILKEIAELVASDRVLVNYDTANAIFYGDVDVVKDFGECMDKVGYIHLKEKAGGRQEWDFPALGEGYVPFPEVFAMLDEADNLSPFSIEIEFTAAGPRDLAEIDQAVLDSAAYLKAQGFTL